MRKFWLSLVSLMMMSTVFSTVAVASVDKSLDEAFAPISNKVQSVVFYSVTIFEGSAMEQTIPLILVWLAFASIFFTIYLGFVNLKMFGYALDLVRGKAEPDEKGDGQINRFQALMTSLSGTVGLGNIAGVAVAISVGGPGALFWMIVMGFFGMSAKFTECALGVKYRQKHEDGVFSGGPMYYLQDGFVAERGEGWKTIGKVMGAFFAVCCIGGAIGGGNMFQANQAYQQFVSITGGEASFFADKGWLFGGIMAVLVASVIIGGIKSIASVTSKIVPLMAGIYLLAGFVVIIMHASEVPNAFKIIFEEAFGLGAAAGGLLGALIQGVRRAAFSNEAGIGSAAIAHASCRTTTHVSQGLVAMLGPFIDTIVICTTTALVIIVTGAYEGSQGMEGVALTSRAFESGISWFPYVLGVAVILFAFSTMISWSYYGQKAFEYLVGESKSLELAYKLFFCAIIILGAAAELNNVIGFTDAMIFAMALPNVIGLYILAPGLKKDLIEYRRKIKERQS